MSSLFFLKDYSYDDVKEKLQQFTMAPKTFSYKGKEHQFSISLGYAEYPTFASNRSQLMRCADAALYEIKLHGKNGCMAYKEGLELRARKQLDLHSRISPRTFQEHLSYTERTKTMTNSFMQTMSSFI